MQVFFLRIPQTTVTNGRSRTSGAASSASTSAAPSQLDCNWSSWTPLITSHEDDEEQYSCKTIIDVLDDNGVPYSLDLDESNMLSYRTIVNRDGHDVVVLQRMGSTDPGIDCNFRALFVKAVQQMALEIRHQAEQAQVNRHKRGRKG